MFGQKIVAMLCAMKLLFLSQSFSNRRTTYCCKIIFTYLLQNDQHMKFTFHVNRSSRSTKSPGGHSQQYCEGLSSCKSFDTKGIQCWHIPFRRCAGRCFEISGKGCILFAIWKIYVCCKLSRNRPTGLYATR